MPTRAQRPRLPETSPGQLAAAQAWNDGLVGTGRKSADTPVVEPCAVAACGTPVTDPLAPVTGMVEVRGSADGAAAHWYCDGRCADIARARADLRAIPMRPDTPPPPAVRRHGRPPRHPQVRGGDPR
ncbi:hypothetical protein JHN63_02095 [Streptomyces sp. MBT65]|uniref:hypothetical protein n=1 Tax=Streptomyces sp. MBT65 TaxID=1488395 RepID=UPI00190DE0FE|nr:hypothetical protein [Streptomyces sp. MBT65]MBK3572633.1 hypothetical protein [Streptomyces sp. MBT65]